MPWTQRQLHQHLAAARLLEHVRDEVWRYLRGHRRASEREVQGFALRQFRRQGLRTELHRPIVAFRTHTATVHYFPPARRSSRLRFNSLILLDLWARLTQPGAPYADLTWMAWSGGTVPAPVRLAFAAVKTARDRVLRYWRDQLRRGQLPSGRELDTLARRTLDRAGYRGKFLHSLGHSLGFDGPHGRQRGLTQKNATALALGIGYTIEPGIYLPRQFGIRLEMNCFVSTARELMLTAEPQGEIVRLRD